ncbi:MAG: di-heme oxidoredictase family protein, partial [Betaproteobacteria bacterium]
DADVTRGEVLFANAKCNACHVADLRTGDKVAIAAAANLTFHPYTDLLLHDMGERLADGRPDFQASGREWRTAPLWGIGLLRMINGHTNLLHDGRARDVTEAILWHAGQAAKAREAFRTMAKEERDALVRFVESL